MKTWFSIRAQADASGHDAIVAIRDYIGEATGAAKEFVSALEASGSKRPLVVINSRGGDVLDSLAIYSAIASLDATVRIAGLALSAASYIAAAAKRVEIVANGWLMIHAPRALTGGTAAELTETAAQLSKFEADYRAAYMRKSGKDETTVAAWLARDTWMNAEEAKAAGLVDVIRPPMVFAASADVGKMASAPDAVRKLPTATDESLAAAVSQTAPEAARSAFRKGIQQSEDGLAGDGLEAATVKEARALASGERPTENKVRKANAWWGRNERFLDAEADTPADVAANLWGGAAGRDWFRSLFNELESETKAAAPNELVAGDYVTLTYGDGETKGEVVEVITTGTASGADGSVEATPEDPAALVDVLREVGTTGQFEETDVQVARLFSALTKTDAPTIVEIESPEAHASDNQTKTMNAKDRLLAILRVNAGAEDTFLASAIEAIGVPADAVKDARKGGKTDFLVDSIKARIDEFEATAKAATDRANAILAKLGVDAKEADPAAKVADVIEAKASAKAAEILAKRGFPPGKIDPKPQASAPSGELRGLQAAVAANRARHAAAASRN